MDKDEALKLALKALTTYSDRVTEISNERKAILAINEALAQPAQEPMDDVRGFLAARLTCWHRLTEKESDELVALFEVKPPQRHWVNLTDDEYNQIWRQDLNNKDLMDLTIAKLKEKNT